MMPAARVVASAALFGVIGASMYALRNDSTGTALSIHMLGFVQGLLAALLIARHFAPAASSSSALPPTASETLAPATDDEPNASFESPRTLLKTLGQTPETADVALYEPYQPPRTMEVAYTLEEYEGQRKQKKATTTPAKLMPPSTDGAAPTSTAPDSRRRSGRTPKQVKRLGE